MLTTRPLAAACAALLTAGAAGAQAPAGTPAGPTIDSVTVERTPAGGAPADPRSGAAPRVRGDTLWWAAGPDTLVLLVRPDSVYRRLGGAGGAWEPIPALFSPRVRRYHAIARAGADGSAEPAAAPPPVGGSPPPRPR